MLFYNDFDVWYFRIEISMWWKEKKIEKFVRMEEWNLAIVEYQIKLKIAIAISTTSKQNKIKYDFRIHKKQYKQNYLEMHVH